ncbi:acetolactate decarboxylase [Enterococcus faecalis]|uniref:acetolactate decarboxylase n=1 Tax=Enterococcus faecalis TaxID=1351 RepID=UPI000A19D057|nr:acetolactate decarboxylase [Enterococcus faecalis]EIQ7139563.1 acetolactate decarboxylase [Enterococcus faecalis]OSM22610.1 acetolactate decarboxylase [Enterococcus faecalis]OSM26848.1 acetolactate decarboxylase [Enterococcus faecalis]WPH46267.1 acetolactate decarboxylase [Enterococcus faecalis]
MSEQYVYQHGTLGGLMESLMAGTAEIGTLLTQGDFGIGTLEGSNGEIILLDGTLYHANQTGEITILEGEELTPYAAVTRFQEDGAFPVSTETDENIKAQILEKISPNFFAAIKISGLFAKMHVRVAPKQEKPYPPFVEAARNQPEFTAENIQGTVVGFFTPKLFHGASAAGFHLHFISEDHQFGGHLLDFGIKQGTVSWMETAELRQHFPVHDADYRNKEIDIAKALSAIEEAE